MGERVFIDGHEEPITVGGDGQKRAKRRILALAKEHSEMSLADSTAKEWEAFRDSCVLAVIYEGVALVAEVERLQKLPERLAELEEKWGLAGRDSDAAALREALADV